MFEFLLPPLLAAAEQVISLIIGLGVLVVWVLGQISEARKQQRRGERADFDAPRERPGQPDQADQLRQ